MKRLFVIAILVFQLMALNRADAAWTTDMFDASHDVQTDMQAIETNINHLKDNFSSATEPSNLSAGQWWYDTTSGILKLRNAANTAWQYIWDFTNNQPMGSITTRGTASYSGSMLLDSLTMSRGTTDTRVATTAFNFVVSSGAPVSKSAVPAGTSLGSSSIPSDRCGAWLFSVNGSGTITVTPAADNYTTGYLTIDAAKTAGNAISTPGGTTRMGYVAVCSASGHSFREDIDALEGGTSGYPASDTDYVPDSPANTMAADVTPNLSAYSVGLYYIKATYKNYITTPTMNLDSLGAKSIKGPDGATLGTGGVILDGHRMILFYDGTDFLLLNPLVSDHGMNAFTSSGTWTKPQGIGKVFVRVWGGGGGSGAGDGGVYEDVTYSCYGGKGGDGGYAEGWIEVSGDVTVTVGSGGTGAAWGGSAATNGTTSSFAGDTTTIQGTGGTAGASATFYMGSCSGGGAGTPGTGSGGTMNYHIYLPTNYGCGPPGGYGQGVSGTSGGAGLVLIYW